MPEYQIAGKPKHRIDSCSAELMLLKTQSAKVSSLAERHCSNNDAVRFKYSTNRAVPTPDDINRATTAAPTYTRHVETCNERPTHKDHGMCLLNHFGVVVFRLDVATATDLAFYAFVFYLLLCSRIGCLPMCVAVSFCSSTMRCPTGLVLQRFRAVALDV